MSNDKTTRQTSSAQDDALAAILAHQEAISDIDAVIANLSALIAARQNEIADAEAAIPSIDHLVRAREDLLASVAIGQAKSGEIKAFDTKSEAERQAHQEASAKAKRTAEEASQAIAGLQRKLTDAQEKRHDLHSKNQWLLRDVLMSRAESTGHAYVQAVLAIKDAYLRLVALDGMLKTKGLRPVGIIGHGVPINLPSFQLPACEGQYNRNYPETLFSDFLAYTSGATDQAHSVLLDELQALGVTLI